MNQYRASGRNISRPSVKVTPTTDLYLNLTRPATAEDPSITIRIVLEPLIVWLWIGGTVMVLGTVLAAFPGRRRNPLDAVSTPVRIADSGGDGAGGDGDRDEVDHDEVTA
jgi:cytochrome c-type biogenesis protein CcmF